MANEVTQIRGELAEVLERLDDLSTRVEALESAHDPESYDEDKTETEDTPEDSDLAL